MRALIVTINRERWPAGLARHWHIVDSYISRHVVTAVEANYGKEVTVTEHTFGRSFKCPSCGTILNE